MSIPDTLITTFLEMRDPAAFRPAYVETSAQIVRMVYPDVPFYRFLYADIGAAWRWRDRLTMSDDELKATLERAETYVLYDGGMPGGYIELAPRGTDVEVDYFGLRPAFVGRGLGKHLLSFGLARAWDMAGVERVWLHTCNLDSPIALNNYRSRGFVIYDEKREPMPERYR